STYLILHPLGGIMGGKVNSHQRREGALGYKVNLPMAKRRCPGVQGEFAYGKERAAWAGLWGQY
ncbi:MAG: hypothetical protein ABFR75_13875, partial [Acidobacteriota bacterium]